MSEVIDRRDLVHQLRILKGWDGDIDARFGDYLAAAIEVLEGCECPSSFFESVR